MSQPVFVRLVEGRLWHLQDGQLLTACGRQVEGDREPERLVGAVPSGAWVCLRCRATVAGWLSAVDQAIKADPRHRRGEPLPDTDVIDAEIVQDDAPDGYPRITEGRYVDAEPTPADVELDDAIADFLAAADAEADRFEAHA